MDEYPGQKGSIPGRPTVRVGEQNKKRDNNENYYYYHYHHLTITTAAATATATTITHYTLHDNQIVKSDYIINDTHFCPQQK